MGSDMAPSPSSARNAPTDRAGIALATALGGLVIIAVLIAGVWFTSNQELRAGTNTFVQESAFRAAELGLNTSLANWENASMTQLPIGGTKRFVYDSSARGWIDSVTITRLTATSYMIASTGTAFGGIQGHARRRTALLVRLSVPVVNLRGAVTAGGEVDIAGSSIISGFDTNPLTWANCPLPESPVAAVAIEDEEDVEVGGCPGNRCLNGLPPILESSDAKDTATYFDYTDETWATLSENATKVYEGSQRFSQVGPALTAEGTCDKDAIQNWGATTRDDPANPCEGYFPVIHAKGQTSTLTLTGGSGQGILLVDGDLDISGGFSFYGPVVVRGRVKASGNSRINGALMAAHVSSNGDTKESSFKGRAAITYSNCAIKKAFESALAPKRITERAWAELF